MVEGMDPIPTSMSLSHQINRVEDIALNPRTSCPLHHLATLLVDVASMTASRKGNKGKDLGIRGFSFLPFHVLQ